MNTTPPDIDAIEMHWAPIAPYLSKPSTEAEYQQAVALIDVLLERIDGDEAHPLDGLLDILSDGVLAYEAQHYSMPERATGVDALRFLIEQHGLQYKDLRNEIGTPSVVSEILSGQRRLTVRMIDALAKRFQVNHSVFFNGDS